jgi:hypothetical protein
MIVKKGIGTWVLTSIAMMFGVMFGYGGPADIEALIAPVAGPTSGKIVRITDKEVCWYVEFKKLRTADPVFFSWVITTPDGRRHYVAPYRPDGSTWSNNTTAPKGQTGRYYNCASKPKGTEEVKEGLSLSAFSEYRVWHGLWTVPRVLGPITEMDLEYGKQ